MIDTIDEKTKQNLAFLNTDVSSVVSSVGPGESVGTTKKKRGKLRPRLSRLFSSKKIRDVIVEHPNEENRDDTSKKSSSSSSLRTGKVENRDDTSNSSSLSSTAIIGMSKGYREEDNAGQVRDDTLVPAAEDMNDYVAKEKEEGETVHFVKVDLPSSTNKNDPFFNYQSQPSESKKAKGRKIKMTIYEEGEVPLPGKSKRKDRKSIKGTKDNNSSALDQLWSTAIDEENLKPLDKMWEFILNEKGDSPSGEDSEDEEERPPTEDIAISAEDREVVAAVSSLLNSVASKDDSMLEAVGINDDDGEIEEKFSSTTEHLYSPVLYLKQESDPIRVSPEIEEKNREIPVVPDKYAVDVRERSMMGDSYSAIPVRVPVNGIDDETVDRREDGVLEALSDLLQCSCRDESADEADIPDDSSLLPAV